MRYEDINKKFTEKVAEYLAKGYQINTSTMGGSQGEIAHVDITDGKEILRIYLDRSMEMGIFNDVVELKVGRCRDRVMPNNSENVYNTIWNNNLEIIFSEKFYQLYTRKNGDRIYGSKEEAEAIHKKHFERCQNSSGNSFHADYSENAVAHKAAVRYLKRSLGKRRITYQVTIQKIDGKFHIKYRSKDYVLA